MASNEDRQRAASTRTGWALSAPALVLLACAASGPLLIVLVYSFLTPGDYGNVIWKFSLDGWRGILFTRDIFDGTLQLADAHLTIFWRSVKLSLLTTAITFLVGFPTAWFIATRPQKSRALWLFLITIPFWTNLLIRTVSLRFLLRDQGPLNDVLIGSGLLDSPLQIINTNLAVQLGLFYSYLPFMVLPIYAAVERYNFALSEAAADLYASRWTTLREIVLPVVRPGIIAGCILVFVPSLGAFLAPDLLGGAKTYMVGSLIEEQFKGSQGNWPFGAAVSVILMTLVLIVLMVYARAQGRAEAR